MSIKAINQNHTTEVRIMEVLEAEVETIRETTGTKETAIKATTTATRAMEVDMVATEETIKTDQTVGDTMRTSTTIQSTKNSVLMMTTIQIRISPAQKMKKRD